MYTRTHNPSCFQRQQQLTLTAHESTHAYTHAPRSPLTPAAAAAAARSAASLSLLEHCTEAIPGTNAHAHKSHLYASSAANGPQCSRIYTRIYTRPQGPAYPCCCSRCCALRGLPVLGPLPVAVRTTEGPVADNTPLAARADGQVEATRTPTQRVEVVGAVGRCTLDGGSSRAAACLQQSATQQHQRV
jgi:hypothetical protein